MIDIAIRTILIENAPVAAVVADRVWPGIREQGERRPGIVLTKLTGSDPLTLEGSAGYETGTIQLDCLALTYREAKELAKKARAALNCYSGTVNGCVIDWLQLGDDSDIPTVPLEGKASPTFGVSIDCNYMHQT